jgi:hypothetical protein
LKLAFGTTDEAVHAKIILEKAAVLLWYPIWSNKCLNNTTTDCRLRQVTASTRLGLTLHGVANPSRLGKNYAAGAQGD